MNEVSPRRILACAAVCAALMMPITGCGGQPASAPPKIGGAQVACGAAPAGSNVNGNVVTSVSAKVTDPNRDLVSVHATINGIPVTLTDANADTWFSWTPPSTYDPIVCKGNFTIIVTAKDAAGHTTHKTDVVTK